MRRCALWLLAVACTSDDPDGPVPEDDPCAWTDPPVLQVGYDLATAAFSEGADIPYGNPPQGGAPYAPFQVRLHAPPPEEGDLARWTVVGVAMDGDTELGSASQPQAFFCSNVGVHKGWLFGGEVHIRFWGIELPDLVDRSVRVDVEVALPDGTVASTGATGTLRWLLGPGAPGEE